jgi:pimeloyl-ACP methyl ester carboxylesterase
METVVLVHGLWYSGWSQALLARRLRRGGFDVRVFSYPTTTRTLAQNAGRLQDFVIRLEAETVHFVGFSLGGVLVRALFHYYPAQKPGRIVTLVAPHGGCRAARAVARCALGRRLLGPGVLEIMPGTGPDWPFPARQVGVISGSLGIGLGRLFTRFPGPNDGVLTLEESQPPEATDRLVLRTCHSAMLLSRPAAEATCRFLRTGRFAD